MDNIRDINVLQDRFNALKETDNREAHLDKKGISKDFVSILKALLTASSPSWFH